MVNSIKAFNAFNKIVKSNIFEKHLYKPAIENPAKFAKNMVLWSVLTKDAVGCYYYVTQSRNNERIPEDKRNFVAAIDLMNGILNVGLQFTIGKYIDKKSDIWFDKAVGKKLHTDRTREISDKLVDIVNKTSNEKVNFEQVEKHLRDKNILGNAGSKAKWLKVGFGAAVMLVATQIITKRVFVPFLATPLAGWFKGKYMDKPKTGVNKVEPKSDAKSDKKPKQTPNLDDKLLDHSTAPWNYSNQYGDKATFKKLSAK